MFCFSCRNYSRAGAHLPRMIAGARWGEKSFRPFSFQKGPITLMGQKGAVAHCSYFVMFWPVHPLAIPIFDDFLGSKIFGDFDFSGWPAITNLITNVFRVFCNRLCFYVYHERGAEDRRS